MLAQTFASATLMKIMVIKTSQSTFSIHPVCRALTLIGCRPKLLGFRLTHSLRDYRSQLLLKEWKKLTVDSQELSGLLLDSQELSGLLLDSLELSGLHLDSHELSGLLLDSQELPSLRLDSHELQGRVQYFLPLE